MIDSLMPRISHLRVIFETEPHSGAWNMAVDEALLETAIATGIATLRWYRWSEPTVSIGYFQKSSELMDDPVLSRLPAVRRLSGGGAILHDDELTYSVTLPASQTLFQQPHELYDIVHRPLAAGLRQAGFPVIFRGTTLKRPDEPLLCFQRQDAHDITLDGVKVLGSAQRRRRGAILQHGSLIQRASPLAKQLPGLTDLSSAVLPEEFTQILTIEVATSIADSWESGSLTDAEIALASGFCVQDPLNVRHR
jgi:lipoate-protein ligase A